MRNALITQLLLLTLSPLPAFAGTGIYITYVNDTSHDIAIYRDCAGYQCQYAGPQVLHPGETLGPWYGENQIESITCGDNLPNAKVKALFYSGRTRTPWRYYAQGYPALMAGKLTNVRLADLSTNGQYQVKITYIDVSQVD